MLYALPYTPYGSTYHQALREVTAMQEALRQAGMVRVRIRLTLALTQT